MLKVVLVAIMILVLYLEVSNRKSINQLEKKINKLEILCRNITKKGNTIDECIDIFNKSLTNLEDEVIQTSTKTRQRLEDQRCQIDHLYLQMEELNTLYENVNNLCKWKDKMDRCEYIIGQFKESFNDYKFNYLSESGSSNDIYVDDLCSQSESE